MSVVTHTKECVSRVGLQCDCAITDTTQPASGVSEEMVRAAWKTINDGKDWERVGPETTRRALEAALSAKPAQMGGCKMCHGRGRVASTDHRGADCPYCGGTGGPKPAQTEQVASVRICVEWAIPQLNCGNMSKDEFFDYLVSLFGTISAHEAVRDVQERWRRDKSERDHLRYVLSREPAQGGEGQLRNISRALRDDMVLNAELQDGRLSGSFNRQLWNDWAEAIGDLAPPQPIPTPDEAFSQKAAKILADIRAGKHHVDPRDIGKMLDRKFDQDFVTWLLEVAALSRARPEEVPENGTA